MIKPQSGFQLKFSRCSADILIGGSGAGVGKTFISLIEPLYHTKNPEFGAVFFRRTFSQIMNEGGLWDESMKLYPLEGARPNKSNVSWTFPSGSKVSFAHLQHEKDIFTWQGSQIPLIVFDELTHFTESMFWYMITRNRSTCGVIPYVRATCNPDPDSWVARFIEWWIDQETGIPIPERSGVLRYLIRNGDAMVWGDSKEEVIEKAPFIFNQFEGQDVNPLDLVKSVTFIPGTIYDNKELLKVNPEYLANLLSQDDSIKAQLLDGNWKVRQDNLSLFDFNSINDIDSNFVSPSDDKYITCDAARFGRDLCVIMVWKGWEVVQTIVMKQSDVHDIVKAVEDSRKKFLVQKSNVLIDQDGVGAGTVRLGGYRGFSGGDIPKKIQGLKESYKNLKTQCFYYLAEHRVNIGDIKININNECCIVDGVRSTKVKMGNKVMDIKELIRDDLRCIKRANVDMDGKKQINTKEEQKIILGRSPDFADTLMMRVYFDLIPKQIYL